MIGLLAVLLLLVPYIVWHLVKLQVIDAEKYQQMAAEQQTRDLLISPSRGTIYDRNNVVLAVSVTVDTIAVAPNEVKAGTEQAIAAGLSEILDLDYDTVLAKVMKKNTMYQLILRRAEPELADQVRQFVKDTGYNSIKFYEDTKRYYPYANLFSSILGFTSYDNEGEYGLELKYDEVLSGVAGRIVTAKDNGGNSLSFYFEQRLEALGYMEEADEVFDDETKGAVTKLQALLGYDITGMPGFYEYVYLNDYTYDFDIEIDRQMEAAINYFK